jgi:hypothetical protein
MKTNNEKGMALITALMMTMIILVIILGLWYVMEQSIKANAARTVYRNVTEAAYGGTDIVMQDIIPRIFQNMSATYILAQDYSSLGMVVGSNACLKQKMTLKPVNWDKCDPLAKDPNQMDKKFDTKFYLSGIAGANSSIPANQTFTVYSKIVDTIPGVQFTAGATGGNKLIGNSVAESSAGTTLNLQHYVYTIEVQGEKTGNPGVKSKLSVLYEY